MSLARIPFIVVSSPYFWKAVSPPPAATTNEVAKEDKPQLSVVERNFGQYIPLLAKIYKAEHTISMLIEIIFILARDLPNSQLSKAILSRLPPSTLAGLATVRVTRQLVLGTALTTAGALIRLAAYKEMGKLFTFHLTLRGDAHKLVTSGIYSVARHPSYTGYWVLAYGATLMSFGHGSVFRECGWLSTAAGRLFLACYLFERISQSLHLVWRARHEDEFLKKQFGDDWEAWARRTPYKFVPYVW